MVMRKLGSIGRLNLPSQNIDLSMQGSSGTPARFATHGPANVSLSSSPNVHRDQVERIIRFAPAESSETENECCASDLFLG